MFIIIKGYLYPEVLLVIKTMTLSLNSSISSEETQSLRAIYDRVRLNTNSRIDPDMTLHNFGIQANVRDVRFESGAADAFLSWIDGEARPAISEQTAMGCIVIKMQECDKEPWVDRILRRAMNNDNICDILVSIEVSFEERINVGNALEVEFLNLLCSENPEAADNLSFRSLDTLDSGLGGTCDHFSKRWAFTRKEIIKKIESVASERKIRVIDRRTGRLVDMLFARTWHEGVSLGRMITQKKWIINNERNNREDWEGGLREERFGYVSRNLFSMMNAMLISKYWVKAFVGYGEAARDLQYALSIQSDHFHDSFSELIGTEFWDIHTEKVSDHTEWDDDEILIADAFLNYYMTFINI